jgi:hypothetical protein
MVLTVSLAGETEALGIRREGSILENTDWNVVASFVAEVLADTVLLADNARLADPIQLDGAETLI